MQIPRWLVFIVAAWVIIFGVFRIYLAVRKSEPEDPKRPNFRKTGLGAQSPRRHVAFGSLYLLLGAILIAMGFGYQMPLAGQGCGNDSDGAEPVDGRSIEVSPGIKTR